MRPRCAKVLLAAVLALAMSGLHGQEAPESGRGERAPRSDSSIGAVPKVAAKTIPESKAGRDILGEVLPIDSLHWLDVPEKERADRPKAVLVRWWTDGCPYCVASLPVLASLQKEFGARGLACKAVYHPKPPRTVPDEAVLKSARSLGFTGPVAVDPDWRFLKKHYLHKGRRHATSVSFLLDAAGTIRFVHGGPVIGVSDAFSGPEIEEEYENLRSAIEILLEKDGTEP